MANDRITPDDAWHRIARPYFIRLASGRCIPDHALVDEPQFPDGIAIFGSDDAAGTFARIYFDERGTSRLMDVTVGDGTLMWRHNDPEFAQSVTITANGDRLVSTGRMSRAGQVWEDDLSQSFVRIATAEEQ